MHDSVLVWLTIIRFLSQGHHYINFKSTKVDVKFVVNVWMDVYTVKKIT